MASMCMLILVVLSVTAAAAAVEIVNPGESWGRCRQVMEGQRLSSCQRYLRDSSRFEESPAGIEGGGWREEFPRCCEALERIKEPCRCEAVKKVVVEESEVGRVKGREMQEMLKTAQSLPSLCRISPPCENIRGPSI